MRSQIASLYVSEVSRTYRIDLDNLVRSPDVTVSLTEALRRLENYEGTWHLHDWSGQTGFMEIVDLSTPASRRTVTNIYEQVKYLLGKP